MSDRSRLSRRIAKQTQKRLLLTLFGTIIIAVLLVKFSIPLIANIAFFISGSKSSSDSPQKNNPLLFVPPPVLNALPNATNSAQIKISGTATSDFTINLYVNESLVDKVKTKNDNNFTFDDVTLSPGENIIKTKAVKENDKESEFSDEFTVLFKNSAPSLSIDSPTNDQSFSKDNSLVDVSGKTDPGTKVTINGFWAIVETDGRFTYKLTLQKGENIIKITAVDEAGNKTESERKVTYNP